MDLYPTVAASGLLEPNDTRRIAQALHAHVRNIHLSDTTMSDALPFVQQLAQHIQNGVLPPHPYAHVHILGIYKECKKYGEGYAFWQWLVEKDENFVNQAVYGAAIELMAYGGIHNLPDLENIYLDGLKRFPSTFAEYHLSPDAIVPDRSQPFPDIRLPILLLQGILTARILCRDWKNAYLALDTALRIFPTRLPPRFFELFIIERPLPEAYTVYLVACRTGVAFKPSHLTSLIKKLRAAMASSSSLQDRILILRAIANAIYAYLEAGGTLEGVHVGAFLTAFDTLLPEIGPGADYDGQEAELRNVIITTAHEIMSTLIQAGMPPHSNLFTSLIHLAGKLRVPDLLNVSLQDVKTARLDIGEIGRRTVLTSAGLLKNKDLIEDCWSQITSIAETEGKQIPYEDWVTFVKASRRANHADFFTEQLLQFEHTVSGSLREGLLTLLDQQESRPKDDKYALMTPVDFGTEIDKLKRQTKNIAAVVMSGQPLDLRKSPFYMFLDPERQPLAPLNTLRAVYDELTVDPHQPPLPSLPEGPPVSSALSPTGIPFDKLRFLNWVSIAELMNEATSFEKARALKVAHSIKHGKPLNGVRDESVLVRRSGNQMPRPPVDQLRRMIKSLRAPDSDDPAVFRRVLSERPIAHPPNKYRPTDNSGTAATSKASSSEEGPQEPLAESAIPTSGTHTDPSLRYYISLESSHDAPAKPTVSRRPLGLPQKTSHHALRLQPTPPSTPTSAPQPAPSSIDEPPTETAPSTNTS